MYWKQLHDLTINILKYIFFDKYRDHRIVKSGTDTKLLDSERILIL